VATRRRPGTALDGVCSRLVGKPVLYVPLSRGGRRPDGQGLAPGSGSSSGSRPPLPRVGLVKEAAQGRATGRGARDRKRPAGAASVSEFDRVFEAATTALVERIVESNT